MIVTPIKTRRIRPNTTDIFEVLDRYLPTDLPDGVVVAITSKVISICEGRLVPFESASLMELIERESDYYLPDDPAGRNITITKNIVIPMAGIDKSSFNQSYILWPKNPQTSANNIREYLVNKTDLTNIGVIITDSTTSPMVRGVRGIVLAHSGFAATKKNKSAAMVSVAGGLAAAAVAVMGEANEQTPLAILSDVPFVQFLDYNPTDQELEVDYIKNKDHDLFAPIFNKADWRKGKRGK